MKQLENLPDIANRNLAGLAATPTMLAKIKLEAADAGRRNTVRFLRPALAVCAALVLCVAAVTSLQPASPVLVEDGAQVENMPESRAAGSEMMVTAEARKLGELPKGSISMSAGNSRLDSTLFAQTNGAGFSLINMNGVVYRLLESPASLSGALLGEKLAAVQEYSVEPTLPQSGVMSNIVSVGTPVHAVIGAEGALVAAKADGVLRVFQRVSYAGTAIIGQETLADTLCTPADVAWMAIDGLGRVEGKTAQTLMEQLLADASYQSTAMSGATSMQIGLTNGLALQLLTDDGCVSACGTWSCPAFFEAFEDAARN